MEDVFRAQMEAFRMEPSPGLWQKVHAKLVWKQFLSFSFQSFNVYYLAAAVAVAGIGAYAWFAGRDLPDPRETIQTPVEQPFRTAPETPPEIPGTAEEETKVEQKVTQERGEEAVETRPAADKDLRKVGPARRKSLPPVVEEEPEPSGKPVSAASSEEKALKSESIRVTAAFTASQLRGCSPLAVEFQNLSENSDQYSWTFGDGGSSSDAEPSYVFDEPGEYTVVLRVTGSNGMEYSDLQTIRVFETPKALFEMDDEAGISPNQPVYFYNYSRGADYYEWDFGDKQGSSLEEPVHYYDKPGNYNVKLIVWTENQCYDSLTILNAFTGSEGEIRFPNAFTPNLSGPSDGYYEMNDISNTIFHPVVSGELTEYQLKVFNRRGLLIFESNDVNIGWDGYHQEKLAAQAVYIWKARGKFSNGKTFVKSGDVTLIRKY